MAMDAVVRKLGRGGTSLADEWQVFLSAFSRRRHLAAGETLVRPGVRCGSYAIVLAGMLARSEALPDGSRQIVALLLPGDIVDPLGFAAPATDHAVGALVASTLATAPHETIAALACSHPRLPKLLMHEAAVEAAILRQWVVNCGRRSAYARMAHLICELYSRLAVAGLARHHACKLPLTQAALSDATGLSVVHVNRVLQQLRADGLISLKSGHLVVHDWPGLCDAAGFDSAYLDSPFPARSEPVAHLGLQHRAAG